MNTAFERIRSALEGNGAQIRYSADRKFTAQCPAHDDGSPSLSVSGIEGQALIHCFGGCATEDVLACLNMAKRDLFDNPRGVTYRYDDGRVVNRTPDKRFSQSGNTKGQPQLYHLSRLGAATEGSVFLVEGEKDVHAIEAAGGIATCNPMGSGNFSRVDVEPLRGRFVTVVVDRDTAGDKWAAEVRHRLGGVAELRFVEASVGKDAADHVAAALPGEELTGWVEIDLPAGAETLATAEIEDDLPVLPAPSDPMAVARVLVADRIHHVDGVPTWAWWRGDFYRWTSTHWTTQADATVEKWAYRNTEHASYEGVDSRGKPTCERWAPTATKVNNLVHALGRGLLQRDYAGETEDVADLIACSNGVLNVNAGELSRHTPARFNLFSLPFPYESDAQCPRWDAFLAAVFRHDPDLIRLLQQWFGYILSGRTDLQKIASLAGPPRCGKGTIYRILQALIGGDACATPDITKLSGQFGEQCLIGKRLATFSDVKWEHRAAGEAVPILLAISGEDSRTIPRKNREDWSGYLPTRFMLMSNDEPSFNNASGAMAKRLVHIKFTESFLGKEDLTLTEDLKREMPGILRWALVGLRDLAETKTFIIPSSSKAMDEKVSRATSPVKAFTDDHCELVEGGVTSVDVLYELYRVWCDRQGQEHVKNKGWFSRDLTSAVGHLVPGFEIRQATRDGVRAQVVFGLKIALDRHGNEQVSPA